MPLLSAATLLALLILTGCASVGEKPTSAARTELAPTGTLRVGVVSAPAPSALFVVKDAKGQPHGVTVDLGSDLARTLGVPVSFLVAPNSGELTRAVSSGSIDVTFLPVDEERKDKWISGRVLRIREYLPDTPWFRHKDSRRS